MALVQHAAYIELLRPSAWVPEAFSPASFERLTSTPGPTDLARSPADDERQVGDLADIDRAWADHSPAGDC